jgi:hypothetical protein
MDIARNATNTIIRVEDLVSAPEGPVKVVSNQHPVALIDQQYVTASLSTLKFKMAKITFGGRRYFSSKAIILTSISNLSIHLSCIFTFIQGRYTMQTEI